MKKKEEEKNEPKDFLFPTQIVEQMYELSGAADAYKGVVICVCSPKGTPQIYTKFDSVVVSLGIKTAVQQWLDNEQSEITPNE